MADVIIMPKQGLRMTEGTLIKWMVEEGGEVLEGEPLFEIETDKLTITIDATTSGTLLKIIRGEGEVVPITEPIAIVGERDEDISGFLETMNIPTPQDSLGIVSDDIQEIHIAKENAPLTSKSTIATSKFASPRAKMIAEEKQIDYREIFGTGPDGLVIERDVFAFTPVKHNAVSPLAKKVAALNNIDLNGVEGTGFHGKVMSNDVHALIAAKIDTRKQGGARGERLLELTGMRKVVATRMKESLLQMAQANHRITVDMTEAVKLREQFKKMEIKISYNDIVLRCVSRALTEFPIMNSSWTDEGILIKEYINLGMAVAVEDGLIVPVIKDADLMTLPEIAACSNKLATKAKENKLQPEDYSGGTFTVSNLGMFDIDGFTAIINPPEAGIIAVGKMAKQPVIINDEIVIRPMMQLSLTYDHRIVDGAPAAQFIRKVKTLLEHPGLLL